MARPSIRRVALRATLILVPALAPACDSSRQGETVAPDASPRGARLVVGTSLDDWSLLAVPRSGGVVEARSLADPTRVVSTGSTRLPELSEAHALSDGLVILRGLDDRVYTYDPPSDVLVRVGEVEGDAAWVHGGDVGLFRAPRGLLEISREGAWRYDLSQPVAWATPVEGGVFVVLEGTGAGSPAWLLHRGDAAPAEAADVEAGPPGVATAWGRRVVLSTPDRRGLVILSPAPIEKTGSVDLGGTISVLITSPSTHEIYAAVDDPPRVEAVNRFDLSTRTVVVFDRPVVDLRPSQFGEALLAHDGSSVHRIPLGAADASRISAAWRPDLPIGLPDGSVLADTEAGIGVVSAATEAPRLIDGADPEALWVVVPWKPASTPVTADRLAGERLESSDDREEAALPVPSAERPGESVAAPDLSDDAVRGGEASGPPPGFYAIVGSARQAAGIQALIASLERAGFSTRMQIYPDEAGRTWYRGLVGPYGTRSEAEAAARQLLRERRLEAWVTEVGARSRPTESPV